jgi:hypothetical protein
VFFRARRCNLCGWTGWRFKAMKAPRYVRKDAVCPRCGSHERHRALAAYLDKNEELNGRRVLDIAPMRFSRRFFAPVPAFRRFFEDRCARYFTTDLFEDAMVKANLLMSPLRTGLLTWYYATMSWSM